MIDHLNKLSWIYLGAETLYFFTMENINDHAKRNLLRYFFVQIDNFIKIVGNYKNELTRQGLLNRDNKILIEEKTRKIRYDYETQYSIIRHKFSGHHQPLSILDIIDSWNDIDLTTIIILYQDMLDIKLYLKLSGLVFTKVIRDYFHLDLLNSSISLQSGTVFRLALDRLAITKGNAITMQPLHESQAKAQIILSIVDLIFINCEITRLVDNADTSYNNMIFDISWLLILCDSCSLLDNLYEDTNYDNSLLSYWRGTFNGYDIIEEGNNSRDKIFEDKIREVRNKIGAHLDINMNMADLLSLFYNINLSELHSYLIYHINIFRRGCQQDGRTKMFAIRDAELSGVKGLAYNYSRKFNN